MSRVLRYLQDAKFVQFGDLFQTEQGVPVLVVTFLAVLELAREGLIEVSQQEAYSPIYVKLRGGQLAAVA
jgi:segregation and condensation protein A